MNEERPILRSVTAFIERGKEKVVFELARNSGWHSDIVLEKKFDSTESWKANCDLELLTYCLLEFAKQVETK